MVPDSDLLFPRPTPQEVLDNLTDFFYTDALQTEAQKELLERKAAVDVLRKGGIAGTLDASALADVLQSSPQALNAVISILGLSQERFLGILSLKSIAATQPGRPMGIDFIRRQIHRDPHFALQIAEFLLEAPNDPDLVGRVPPFDLDKFDRDKLLLDTTALIDSLLRSGLKGRYDAKKGRILEDHIEEVLRATGVTYVAGETRLPGLSRNLDFVVPNSQEPFILIESGLFETTARELSDKGRVEALGLDEIERRYPNARFVRVTDGVGWKRRGGHDLERLIQASHYFLVFKTLPKLGEIVRHHVPGHFFRD